MEVVRMTWRCPPLASIDSLDVLNDTVHVGVGVLVAVPLKATVFAPVKAALLVTVAVPV